MASEIVIIHIDYDEGDVDTYSSVRVTTGNEIIKIFDTGDVFLDYASALTWSNKQGFYVTLSSDVDHFVVDSNGKYEWTVYNNLEVIVAAE